MMALVSSQFFAGSVWGFYAGMFVMSVYFFCFVGLAKAQQAAWDITVILVASAIVITLSQNAISAQKPRGELRAERYQREAITRSCVDSCRAECTMTCTKGK